MKNLFKGFRKSTTDVSILKALFPKGITKYIDGKDCEHFCSNLYIRCIDKLIIVKNNPKDFKES